MHVEEQGDKNLSISSENPYVLNIPWCTHDIRLMYSWYPPMYSWYPPMYSWYSPMYWTSPECTEHTLYRVISGVLLWIFSIHEAYMLCQWGRSLAPVRICVPTKKISFHIHLNVQSLKDTEDTHKCWWSFSWVLLILTCTDDMLHGYCWSSYWELTLYELYAVPMRICITRESYHQYPWVISSVLVRVCSTH